MSKLGLEGRDLGHQLGNVLFGGHSEVLLLLMLRVSRLKLSLGRNPISLICEFGTLMSSFTDQKTWELRSWGSMATA